MTDIVYTLGTGSRLNNVEVRYSIRSMIKFGSNLGRVAIVGACPPWLRPWKFIPRDDPYENPDANMAHKVIAACIDPEISDPFLACHDDHFMLQPFDADAFPAYRKIYRAPSRSAAYARRVMAGYKLLEDRLGIRNPKNFDTHTPILVYKKDFLLAYSRIDLRNDVFTFKTVYGNQCAKLSPVLYVDCKVYPKERLVDVIKGKVCFSTSNNLSAQSIRFWASNYPDASPYESEGL